MPRMKPRSASMSDSGSKRLEISARSATNSAAGSIWSSCNDCWMRRGPRATEPKRRPLVGDVEYPLRRIAPGILIVLGDAFAAAHIAQLIVRTELATHRVLKQGHLPAIILEAPGQDRQAIAGK